MTYEEAKRYAEGLTKNGGNVQRQEFVKVVIEALERQIPMKPMVTNLGSVTRCPKCEAIHYKCLPSVNIDYCCRCGQAIDWRIE